MTDVTIHDPKSGEEVKVKPGSSDEFAGVSKDGSKVSIVGDPDPLFDDCSNKSSASTDEVAQMHSRNIGDQMNDKNVTWGWFQGGFRPTEKATDSQRARCGAAHKILTGQPNADYNPHHQPFQYYASTANPHNVEPSSPEMIGKSDQANHQYGLSDFDTALKNGNLPAVSFLKAGNYQDGPAGYSNPLDEQAFITHYINGLQSSKEWDKTAVVIAYDDSDGWYDHKAPQVLNGSKDQTKVEETGKPVNHQICTMLQTRWALWAIRMDNVALAPASPCWWFLLIQKVNHVDNTYTEQTAIKKLIQDNWSLGRLGGDAFIERAGELKNMFDFSNPDANKVFLNETDGTVAGSYDQVKRVDNAGRETTSLKPVAQGMNDPNVTEKGVKNVADQKDDSHQDAASDSADSSNKALWWVLGIVIALVLIGLIIFAARNGGDKSPKRAEANRNSKDAKGHQVSKPVDKNRKD